MNRKIALVKLRERERNMFEEGTMFINFNFSFHVTTAKDIRFP